MSAAKLSVIGITDRELDVLYSWSSRPICLRKKRKFLLDEERFSFDLLLHVADILLNLYAGSVNRLTRGEVKSVRASKPLVSRVKRVLVGSGKLKTAQRSLRRLYNQELPRVLRLLKVFFNHGGKLNDSVSSPQ
jgi:hypothetical protein